MIGQIWRYNKDTRVGHIIGRDNRQYEFAAKNYQGSAALEKGNMVEFISDGNAAREIRLLTSGDGKL